MKKRQLVGMAILAALEFFVVAAYGVEPAAAPTATDKFLEKWVQARTSRVMLDAGEYPLPRGVSWPTQEGGVFEGAGAAQPIPPGHPLAGPVTRIVWAGDRPTDEPLIRYSGAETRFSDLCLDGATRVQIDAGVPRGGTAFRVEYKNPGLAVGGIKANNIFTSHWKIGLQIGVWVGESNCERCDWTNWKFNREDIGVKLVNIQGMGHRFDSPEFSDVDKAFRIEGGGQVTIDDPLLHGHVGTFLEFAPPSNKTIGPNNGRYTVNNLELDNTADAQVLYMKPGIEYGGVVIVFNGGVIQDNAVGAIPFRVSGAATVIVRDMIIQQKDLVLWDNDLGTEAEPGPVTQFIFERCRFTKIKNLQDAVQQGGSRGRGYVALDRCFDAKNRPINEMATLTGTIK